MAMVMTAEDKRWQAEQDARTLAESEVIKNDETRLSAAKEAAARMAEKEREEAAAMQKVAGTKARKQTTGTGSNRQGSAQREGTGKRPSTKHNVFQRI